MEILELDKDNCPIDDQPADYIVCSDCPYCAEIDSCICECVYREEENDSKRD